MRRARPISTGDPDQRQTPLPAQNVNRRLVVQAKALRLAGQRKKNGCRARVGVEIVSARGTGPVKPFKADIAMTQLPHQFAPPARWVWAVMALGLAWNLFGRFQLVQTLQQTEQNGIMQGLSAEAARRRF